jgi:hypothetical protein
MRADRRPSDHAYASDEERVTADIVELASQWGHYGYRKIAELCERR